LWIEGKESLGCFQHFERYRKPALGIAQPREEQETVKKT